MNNIKDCEQFIGQNFQRISRLHTKDSEGNLFIPWHVWHSKALKCLKDGDKSRFRYFNNALQSMKTGYTSIELPVEVVRLMYASVITKDEYNSLINMLKSEDKENFVIALEIIKNYRKVRFKLSKHKKRDGSVK